jgi:CDP-diacylglycerol--glycerol-3-phosphate 3-phosphatidyltransferase
LTLLYIDLFFSLGMWALLIGFAVLYLIRSALRGRARFARTDADGGSVFLSKRIMEMAYWVLNPVIDGLVALRITPNQVTAFSLLPALGAGVAVAFGMFGLASMLATMATLSDIVDGVLARRTGVSSDAGEVFDAAVDRYGEFFLLGGMLIYWRDQWSVMLLVLAAIIGSFMVSYATAKAEALRVPAPRGAMRRSERAVYLIVASALTAITKVVFVDVQSVSIRELPIMAALTIVGTVANISVMQRLGAIMQSLRARQPTAPEAGAPPAPEGIVPGREESLPRG